MKKIISLLFFLTINILVYSQSEYPLSLTIHKNSNWDVKVDTIKETKFDHTKISIYQKRERKVNFDSIFRSKVKAFPQSISLTDSCYVLKGLEKDIKLCRGKPSVEKHWSDFKLIDIKNDYFIFYEYGYEWWNIISFKPSTREYYATFHPPIFISDDLVYSFGNYYAEGQFQIIDNKNNRYFGFETFNWELIGLYRIDKTFYVEFANNAFRKNKKYLSITYN